MDQLRPRAFEVVDVIVGDEHLQVDVAEPIAHAQFGNSDTSASVVTTGRRLRNGERKGCHPGEMAMVAPSDGTPTAVPRVALAVAAVLLVGTGLAFAASWIDAGVDSTCGSVIHPDVWLHESVRSRCRAVMLARCAISAAALAAGVGTFYLSLRRRPVVPAIAVGISHSPRPPARRSC
ncbi:MAG: hypothetical protein H0V33_05335 [Acidimicrobiia bacterium]|nr:hypothetical protein [Acidimicrobiia bacterium]